MDPNKRAELDKKLAQLREFYVKSLPAEFEKLALQLRALRPDEPPREIISEIHQALHKFAGSGGSFGFHELSANARRIEQSLLLRLNNEDSLFTKQDIDELSQNVLDLKKLVFTDQDKQQKNEQSQTAKKVAFSTVDSSVISSRVKKICLIEPNKSLHESLADELGSFNFEIIAFSCFGELDEESYNINADLVLLDLELLELNQTTNTYSLPNTILEQKAPVIVIGKDDDFSTRLAVAKLDAQGYFITPFDTSDLANRITQVFERQLSEPGKVLIVDDDLQLARYYKLVLESADFIVDFVTQPEKLISRLDLFKPELVLMDLNMPNISGRDLAGVIRQYKRYASLPIVFLSAETSLSIQLDALSLGADDFLTKPISDEGLILAVHSRVHRARTLSSLIKKDGLTGLLTHSNIKEMAEYELNRAKRTLTTQSFAMLDIDHFKTVNDSYGHSVGDTVIASLSTLLKQRLRTSDLIGRYGGEEFLVVLPECDLEKANALLEDIRVLFEKIQFQSKHQKFSCSISIGIASTNQFLTCSSDELINSADKALYEAKKSGRNKVVLYGKAPA